jgi:hypothetical protein
MGPGSIRQPSRLPSKLGYCKLINRAGRKPVFIFMATSKKAARKTAVKRQRSPWNTSEILYAVYGYLTTRKTPLILSASHGAGPVAEILGAIAKANNLPPTRKNWKKIAIPEGIEHITNAPGMACSDAGNRQAPKPPQAAELVETVFGMMQRALDLPEQNKFIAGLLARMRESRSEYIAMRENEMKHSEDSVGRARKIYDEFVAIVKNT